MSDTVKLIVEIPKEDFKKLVNPYQHNEIWCNRLKRMVMNGIPLDEVKAEIENQKGKWDDTSSDTCFNMVLEIIDKYIGGNK